MNENTKSSAAALEAWYKPEPNETRENYSRRTGRDWPYPSKGGILQNFPPQKDKTAINTPITQEGEPLAKEEHLVLPENVDMGGTLLGELADEIALQGAADAQFAPIQKVLDGTSSILRYKNNLYGNSALDGNGVFSKQPAVEKLLSRADDKIARIKNSPTLRKNDVADLLGYLVLICAANGWDNFDEFKD